MFRALLCPSSGARDYMCVITAYGVMPWLLVVGSQVQGSRICVQVEGFSSTKLVELNPSIVFSVGSG